MKSSRARRLGAFLFGLVVAGCTPVSKSYEVHSAEMSCDEANRFVYGAISDMHMKVTSFTQAQPGRPGHLSAVGRDRKGEVTITCDQAGVHVDPRQTSMGDRVFERGIFLSVTGRGGLHMDRGEVTGRDRVVGDLAQAASEGVPPASGMVEVAVQPQKGFETVLDFDADLAAAGVLPLKITIRNGTRRAYDFSLDGVTLRLRGSGDPATRLAAREAVARLEARAASGDSIGNVASAARILVEKEIRGGRLKAGDSVTGYVYYPVADYERAKVQLTDVAAGEPESFLVEF